MERTISFKTAKGTEITVAVDYYKSGNGFESDGYVVKSTKVSTCFEIRFLGLGKELASSFDVNFCEKFDNANYPDKTFVCDRLLFTTEEKEMIDTFIKQVIAEYETPAELAELENSNIEKANSVKIAKAEKVIARAENEKVYTTEEAARKTRKYNDLYNEGAEGFTPSFLTTEEVENAKSILNK